MIVQLAMGATFPRREPALIGPLLPGHDLGRHESDVIHVGRAADIDYLRNIGEIDIIVALDEHDTLGAVGVNFSQLGQKVGLGEVGLVDLVVGG